MNYTQVSGFSFTEEELAEIFGYPEDSRNSVYEIIKYVTKAKTGFKSITLQYLTVPKCVTKNREFLENTDMQMYKVCEEEKDGYQAYYIFGVPVAQVGISLRGKLTFRELPEDERIDAEVPDVLFGKPKELLIISDEY